MAAPIEVFPTPHTCPHCGKADTTYKKIAARFLELTGFVCPHCGRSFQLKEAPGIELEGGKICPECEKVATTAQVFTGTVDGATYYRCPRKPCGFTSPKTKWKAAKPAKGGKAAEPKLGPLTKYRKFMARLEKLEGKYEIVRGKPASDKQIAAMEKKLKVTFSPEYRVFLREVGALEVYERTKEKTGVLIVFGHAPGKTSDIENGAHAWTSYENDMDPELKTFPPVSCDFFGFTKKKATKSSWADVDRFTLMHPKTGKLVMDVRRLDCTVSFEELRPEKESFDELFSSTHLGSLLASS